jgi:hypothetical protein
MGTRQPPNSTPSPSRTQRARTRAQRSRAFVVFLVIFVLAAHFAASALARHARRAELNAVSTVEVLSPHTWHLTGRRPSDALVTEIGGSAHPFWRRVDAPRRLLPPVHEGLRRVEGPPLRHRLGRRNLAPCVATSDDPFPSCAG